MIFDTIDGLSVFSKDIDNIHLAITKVEPIYGAMKPKMKITMYPSWLCFFNASNQEMSFYVLCYIAILKTCQYKSIKGKNNYKPWKL